MGSWEQLKKKTQNLYDDEYARIVILFGHTTQDSGHITALDRQTDRQLPYGPSPSSTAPVYFPFVITWSSLAPLR